MKVWFVHQFALPPKCAGVTRHFSLARELVKLGHEVTIIAANQHHRKTDAEHIPEGEDWKLENYDGVNFIWLKNPNSRPSYFKRIVNMFSFGWKVARFNSDIPKPDIIIGCSPDPVTAYSAYGLSKRLGCRYTAHIGDFWPMVLTDMSGISKHHPFIVFLGWLEKKIYKKAELIICPLPAGWKRLRECGVNSDKFLYLPNGVDLENIPPLRPPEKRGQFTFMFAGSHVVSCCLDNILDAIKLIQRKYPELNAQYRFIGEGGEKPRLIEKSKDMRLQNVYFENAVPKEQILNKLMEADAFMNAVSAKKSYQYGISMNKLFDYMAAGRPTVIAVTSYNNPIEEERCGLTVPAENIPALAEAMNEMAHMSVEQRIIMGERAYEALKREYNFENLGRILEASLLSLLKNKRPE